MYSLDMFFTVGPNVSYNYLAGNHVREVILSIANRQRSKIHDRKDIDGVMKSQRIDMRVKIHEVRVIMLLTEFDKNFCDDRMDKYVGTNPKSSINLILEMLQPPQLRTILRNDIDSSDKLIRNFLTFMNHVKRKANKIEAADACYRSYREEQRKQEKFNPTGESKGGSDYKERLNFPSGVRSDNKNLK